MYHLIVRALVFVGTKIPIFSKLSAYFPRVASFISNLSKGSLAVGAGGFLAKSLLAGLVINLVGFVGGIAFFVLLGNKWVMHLYMNLLDVLFTPVFAAIGRLFGLFFDNDACPELPDMFTVFFGVFDFLAMLSLLFLAIGIEIYIRILFLFFFKARAYK